MSMTVIVDCNSICHRVRHTLGSLSHNEQAVGVIFGFLRQLQTIAKRLNTNKFLFCWDSRSSKRQAIYPQYKSNRHKEKTEEERELDTIAYSQFTELRTVILPKIGFRNNFFEESYESDDIIARLVKDNGHSFVIVSTDGDLFQLLRSNVSMLIANDKPLFTEESFRQKYLVSPDQWPIVKAIAGCGTDNVEGIKGVGEKTAIKFINNELKSTSKSYREIKSSSECITKNMQLVKLPFEGLRGFTIKEDKLSFDGFLEVCNKYGFYSLTSKESLNFWRRMFFS